MAEPADVIASPDGWVRRRWDAMALRQRLVAGLLLVVVVTLIAAGAATYTVLSRSLVAQVDDGLTSVRDQVIGVGGVVPGGRVAVSDAIRAWTQQGAVVYLITPDGSAQILTTTYGGAKPTPEMVSAADLAALDAVPTGRRSAPVTVTLSDTGESRAVALADATGSRLVAAQPLSRVDSVTRTFLVIELLALLAAVLVVAIAGSWWIRRSLRPLRRVADTAGQVAVLALDRGDVTIPGRVAETNPATEVGQVGSAVNAMLDHVESSLRARQDTEDRLRRFVSDAGHELRTPLAAVRGYAELVRRAGDRHPEQALTSAVRIESAAARMGVLVEDLLLLASLDEGRPLDRAEVDLAGLAEDAVAEARTAESDHDWIVGPLGPDVTVTGDPGRLHQVIANLLGNAANHTPPGTTITTSVLRFGPYVQLEVRDNGPGFAADLLPRATERFARGDSSRSRATGGSGLGLAIVRAIVDSHGGHLSLANDGGAVVTVHLPLGRPGATTTA
ncbi:MAG TPA: HAMP domain-containing sensor histidine kinase [Candidatus Nanopelagicales bacterium]|nr:HAMP domain-containing sensor histidine kinase [Candidatus Nanopelagicales bacterium]